MRNELHVELRRALLNKKILLLVLVGVIIHLYSMLMWHHSILFFDFAADDINLASAIKMVKRETNKYMFWHHGMDLYTVFMPLLACLPFSTSLMIDKKSTFINFIITRTKKKKYLISKIIANALAGGLILVIPSLIFYIGLTIKLPPILLKDGVHPVGFMSTLFLTHPEQYIVYTMLIEFLFGATYATFSMAVSKFTENTVIIILTPFVFWYVATFIMENYKLMWLSPAVFNAFMVRKFSNVYEIIGQAIVISGISIYFILKKGEE